MSFPLVGNSKIKAAVINALHESRLPHAILLEGDLGTGKHTLANYIATAAVCGNQNPPCGECKNCSAAKSGNHPDIDITAPEDGKKNIAVAQIRRLKSEAYVKPHMSERRVFIIDCADTMNEQSQNALLKVLEEPPGGVMFILIAESKAALLETIISRCVVLTLSPPEAETALSYISETTRYDCDSIADALKSSQNNIGRALSLLAGRSSTKTEAAAKEYLECMRDSDIWGMLEITSAFEKNRVEAEGFFKDLKRETALKLRSNPAAFNAKSLSRLYSLLCELEQSLKANINLNLLFCTLAGKTRDITKDI